MCCNHFQIMEIAVVIYVLRIRFFWSFAMNCSVVVGYFHDLLLLLANFTEIRGWVFHTDTFCVTQIRKIARDGIFIGGNGKIADNRFIQIFFSGYDNVNGSWVENEDTKIALLDVENGKWRLNGLNPKTPLLRTSLRNINVSIALNTAPDVPLNVSSRQFARSLSALYWSILVNHYKFRIVYKKIERPVNDQSFNSVQYTFEQFLLGGYDTMSNLYLISTERVEKLSFIIIGLEVKYHFIIRRPEYKYSWLAVVRPLASSLWYGICCMIFAIGISLAIAFGRAPASRYRPNICTGIFLAFGIACSQGLKSTCTQIAFYSALTFFANIQQFYVSNLYSMLATREIFYPFNTIDEFIERKTHKLAISPDTSVYSAFQSARNQVFRRVWEGFLFNDPSHVINETNMPEIIERVCQGNTAVFAVPLQMVRYTSDHCPLMAVPAGYFPNDMAIAARKDFPYVKHFQELFLRTMESGISNYLKRKYVMTMMPGIKKTDLAVDPIPVSLHQVLFIFAIFGVGAIISIFLLIIEHISFINHKKTKQI